MRTGVGSRAAAERRHDDQVGAVAVLFGILALILFVLAGLVVNLGQARDVRRQSQNAADASALAASAKLYPSNGTCVLDAPAAPPCYKDAVRAATEYAAANFSTTATDWSGCTDASRYYSVPGQTPCVSFTDAGGVLAQSTAPVKPLKVRVAMPIRQVSGGLISLGTSGRSSSVPVGSQARVALDPGGQADCGLCLVGDVTHSLQNGDIDLQNTSLQANNIITAKNNGGVAVTGGTIGVSGASCGNCTPSASVKVNQPDITDPLAGITLPTQANAFLNSPTGLKTNPCVDGPGFYKSPAPSPGGCSWKTGLYVITGSVGGNVDINATAGVTMYFTCGTSPSPTDCSSSGAPGGSLGFVGNGAISIKAPTTGATAGLSIVYDRHNTADMDFKGNGAGTVSGTLYAISSTLGFRGNGAGDAIDSLIVVNDIDFRGNPSALTMTYGANTNVKIPPGGGSLDQ